MKKFIVIYNAPDELLTQSANANPEEMEKGMEAWMTWASLCGEHLVDLGNPLMNGERLQPESKSEKSTRGVCGYSILQANDLHHAKKLLIDHPHLAWSGACEIEIHEATPLPGQ